MPAYIRLCMDTWPFPYTVLNYSNIHNYTDLQMDDRLKRFSLPQIADVVRVHVLRDQGGYWLDADTVMVTDKLPGTTMIGDPQTRANTIGYLYAHEAHMDMFEQWADYQDKAIVKQNALRWDIMGNAFTDQYVKDHPEISIAPVERCWPETYMIKGDMKRSAKYERLYFHDWYGLSDLKQTDMLMLHNSWTPEWFKRLAISEVITYHCTLSNILLELIEGD